MSETVLITGSSRGIGKAIALRLAQSGFDIVVHCRSRVDEAELVAQTVRELGQQARVLQFDVSNRAEVADILTADVETNGASLWGCIKCRINPRQRLSGADRRGLGSGITHQFRRILQCASPDYDANDPPSQSRTHCVHHFCLRLKSVTWASEL